MITKLRFGFGDLPVSALINVSLAFALLMLRSNAMAGVLYVASVGGNIYRYTPSGIPSVLTSGHPYSLACDPTGNLFDLDDSTGNINKFTPAGSQSIFGNVNIIGGLGCDANGNVFAASGNNIFKFTPAGSRSTFATGFVQPQGIAFDGSGNTFISDYNQNNVGEIYEFSPAGSRSTFAAGLNGPDGLAFDANGNLFEADIYSGKIYEFTPAGAQSTFASGLQFPEGLAFDADGNLFESDEGSGNIFKFTPNGTRSTFATGVDRPTHLAFSLVPEPRSLILLLVGALALTFKQLLGRSISTLLQPGADR
jgi:sugar lactone lactonase YvrE